LAAGNTGCLAATNTHALVPGDRTECLAATTLTPKERILYVNHRVTRGNTATRESLWPPHTQKQMLLFVFGPIATIRREYRIAIHPTIRTRSEYEANIRCSPTGNTKQPVKVEIQTIW